MVERTAKADFTSSADGLRVDGEVCPQGTLVKAGQVVEVASKARLKSLVTAGVAAETDEENEGVPRLKPPVVKPPAPPVPPAPPSPDLVAARAKADEARKAVVAAIAALDEAKKAKKDAKTIADAESRVTAAEASARQAQAAVEALEAKAP